MYGLVPPPAVTVALPLAAPWQVTFVPDTELVSADGSVTVKVAVIEQLFASATVKL